MIAWAKSMFKFCRQR